MKLNIRPSIALSGFFINYTIVEDILLMIDRVGRITLPGTRHSIKINENENIHILFGLEKSKEIVEDVMAKCLGKDPHHSSIIIDDREIDKEDMLSLSCREMTKDILKEEEFIREFLDLVS